MVAKEIFVIYYNFDPLWLQHASFHVKTYWNSSKKRSLSRVSYKIYSEPGVLPELEPEP